MEAETITYVVYLGGMALAVMLACFGVGIGWWTVDDLANNNYGLLGSILLLILWPMFAVAALIVCILAIALSPLALMAYLAYRAGALINSKH